MQSEVEATEPPQPGESQGPPTLARTIRALFRLLRPHHWLKNLLVFVAIFLGGRYGEAPLLLASVVVFFAFSCVASAGYIFNDLLDLAADRAHPIKRSRPLAAEALSVPAALAMLFGLLFVGFALTGVALNPSTSGILFLYFLTTTTYSLWWKKIAVADVLFLAGLHGIRILAGGLATGIAISDWTLAFAMFLFTSLALAKRHAELTRLLKAGESEVAGRGYFPEDVALLQTVGVSCACISTLVLALFIKSPEVSVVHERSWPLWLLCPLMLFWICRIWLLAARGRLNEDPILFAAKDKVSLLLGLAMVGLVMLARLPVGSFG